MNSRNPMPPTHPINTDLVTKLTSHHLYILDIHAKNVKQGCEHVFIHCHTLHINVHCINASLCMVGNFQR